MTRPKNSEVVRVEFETHQRRGRGTSVTVVRRLLRSDLPGKTVSAALRQLNKEADQDDTFSTYYANPPCFVVKPGAERQEVKPGSRTKLNGGDKLIVTVK